MKRILYLLKQLKLRDFLAPFVFIILFIPSLLYKMTNKLRGRKLWLVAENGEARDNGYHFFKYVRENHPEDPCYFAVMKDSAGLSSVKKLGNAIYWGSLKHWFYYMSADLNISSQKNGNPSPIFWYFMHRVLGVYRNRVFLQHGITHNNPKLMYHRCTKFKYFICGAKQEAEFIKENFGYPDGAVVLTGFPRWDNLKNLNVGGKQKSILIMPTWRKWIGSDKGKPAKVKNFKDTDYYKKWNGLLHDRSFIEYIEKEKITVYFYPHACMQKFLDSFMPVASDRIKIVSIDQEIQDFFCKCDLMITDYSSVAFDFAYLEKPIIYYQFDKQMFRDNQYDKGYFEYERDGFGPVCETLPELLEAIMKKPEKKYLKREKEFFGHHDNKNSERVYEVIQ